MEDRRTGRFHGVDDRDGCRYIVALDTLAGARVFVSRDAVALVSAQFLRAAAEERVEILTYCFMPDQARMLVERLNREGDARAFVASARRYSARRYYARTRRALWHRDSVACALPDAREALEVSRGMRASWYSGSFAWDRVAALATARP